jgi:hypothetical protein
VSSPHHHDTGAYDAAASKQARAEGESGGGRHSEQLFVILEGRARVIRSGRTVARMSSGDFFGEISLLDGGPRTATVVADGPVRCLVLLRKEFAALLTETPQIATLARSEPWPHGSDGWSAPLTHDQCARRDSNPRHSDPKSDALSGLSYGRLPSFSQAVGGLRMLPSAIGATARLG